MTEQEIADYKAVMFDGKGQSNTQAPTPEPENTPPAPAVEEKVIATPVADTPVVPIPDNSPIVTNELKDKLGFEDWDSAKAAIDELKQKAETPAEIKFANEQSELIVKALAEGNTDPLYDFLATQKRLSEVDAMTPDAVLKLHIQQTYKHYKEADVLDVFEEKYSYPEKPVQGDMEEEDVFNLRLSKWEESKQKVDRRKERDSLTAKEELLKLKSELVIPNINKPTVTDEAYEKYKQEEIAISQMRELDKKEYAKLSTKDVKMLFKFNDEASKLAFDIEYEPEKEGFDKAISDASDLTQFFDNYYDKDGNPNRKELAKAVYIARNIDKIVSEAMVEAVNQTRLDMLRKQKNIGDGTQRNYVIPPMTDVDRLRQSVFS